LVAFACVHVKDHYQRGSNRPIARTLLAKHRITSQNLYLAAVSKIVNSVLDLQRHIDLDQELLDRLHTFDCGCSKLHNSLRGEGRESSAELECVDLFKDFLNPRRCFLLMNECFCQSDLLLAVIEKLAGRPEPAQLTRPSDSTLI
jgi:hypothetical protein